MINPNRTPFLLFLLVAIVVPALVWAATLDELRADGTVGERYDGIVVVRAEQASQEVREQVAEINEKRRELYRQRAEEEGVTPDQVGRVYARKIYEKAPVGTWFLDLDREWSRKK